MKRVISIAGAAAFGIALLTFSGGTAQADPYGCTSSKPNSWTYNITCTEGTGTYRAYTKCDASLAFDYTDYGSTVRVGQTSSAVCIRASIKDRAIAPQGVQIMSM